MRPLPSLRREEGYSRQSRFPLLRAVIHLTRELRRPVFLHAGSNPSAPKFNVSIPLKNPAKNSLDRI